MFVDGDGERELWSSFTPVPTPINMTIGKKSLLDTYGEDATMMVFMCFTVLLAGLMVVLALIPWDSALLRTSRLVINHTVFGFGILCVVLSIVFWSEYDDAMCEDTGEDCCADG